MSAFIPSLTLLAALIAALALPVLLIALSHPPLRVEPPGRRFRLAVLGMVGVWLVLLALLPGERPAVGVVCGALILFTAVQVGFSIWTLLAHGFTISMLLSLAEAKEPLSLDDWIRDYCGAGLEAFAQDRMQLLFRFGMVVEQPGGVIRATPRGVTTGRLTRLGMTLFAIDPEAAA